MSNKCYTVWSEKISSYNFTIMTVKKNVPILAWVVVFQVQYTLYVVQVPQSLRGKFNSGDAGLSGSVGMAAIPFSESNYVYASIPWHM